jgi:hypothetical protein
MTEATETTAKIKFAEKSSEGTIVSIKFGNGSALSLDVSTLDQDIQTELMIHGALQKIGDSYAGAAGDYAFAETAASKVIENLVAGLWKSAREGGEGKPRTTELAEAVSRIKGMELAQAVEIVNALSDEQRKALRGKDKVKAVIAQIRFEKASKKAADTTDDDLGL